MKTAELVEFSNELFQQRQPHAWITVVAVKPPSSAYVGAQAIVTSDGELHGWVGGGCVQSTARAAALASLTSMAPQRLRLSNASDGGDDPDVRPMNCPSNGEIELFIQPVAVTPRLRIHGKTPVARAAAWLAREADFETMTDAEAADAEAVASVTATSAQATTPAQATTAAYDATGPNEATLAHGSSSASTAPVAPLTPASSPDSYALIATQGDGDESALEEALRSPARAVLVIASKRKAERLRATMIMRGIPEARLAAIRAPAGPDIGAVTPNEIALAAIAGLVALRRGQPEPGKKASGTPQSPTRTEKNQVTGYVNPVCGAVVDPARALSTLTMGGQTHYFCCQGCRVEFDRDPQKYLDIAAHMRAPVAAVE
jgi:xanthine dehydrogenase accessory factor